MKTCNVLVMSEIEKKKKISYKKCVLYEYNFSAIMLQEERDFLFSLSSENNATCLHHCGDHS